MRLPVSIVNFMGGSRSPLVLDGVSFPFYEMVNLEISRNASGVSLWAPDTVAASPGRYVENAVYQLAFQERSAEIIVLNPTVRAVDALFHAVLETDELAGPVGAFVVFADLDNVPAAYRFPANWRQQTREFGMERLRFLSCANAALDADYLQVAFDGNCVLKKVPARVEVDSKSGFRFHVAARRVAELRSACGSGVS